MTFDKVASMVDPQLLAAYRKTSFIVEGPESEAILLVGELNPAVDALLERYGARQCAFLTAWNPHSKRLEAHDNRLRQDGLVEAVRRSGRPFLRGRGAGKDSDWPAEDSILVIGVDRVAALELGRAFGQAAIVFKEMHHPVELLLCEP